MPNPANFPRMVIEETSMNVLAGEVIKREIRDKRGKVKYIKTLQTGPIRKQKKDPASKF